ncbi:hypothetical protein SAMN05216349_10834 [Oribacterium sp. KHPX15]|uniref:hypothetical protein n=1 Tax=unclassified Oribacterium TaxID=2629782 RepID=UPI0004E142F5|nr:MULTISPECIES: hypothetical protein [unclassified Oribacterium]SEA27071.1 hypothetical protein SAMN05216349_10834 [Oribacterium sp. KHPX15]
MSNDKSINYLEKLSDEEFFKKRYTVSEADQAVLDNNSVIINGRRFYRASVKEKILKKYARESNPKQGEPGSIENPLVRFGKEYVYSETGELIEYVHDTVHYVLRSDMKPNLSQKKMIEDASTSPIKYSKDCPELTEHDLNELVKSRLKHKKVIDDVGDS